MSASSNITHHHSPDTLKPCNPAMDGPAWHEATEAGWDMTLITEAMRLPVWERLQQHRAALALATTLREAMTKHHA